MGWTTDLRRATATFAAVTSVLSCGLAACGGGADAAPDSRSSAQASASASVQPAPALAGPRVQHRDQALQIVVDALATPLRCSELAHAVLARAFESRPPAAERWQVELNPESQGAGRVTVELQAADNADGLLRRGEPGAVHASLRFDGAAVGPGLQFDGTLVLDVARRTPTQATARRTRADMLEAHDGRRTLRWSYLDIEIDAQQVLRRLSAVADVPVQGLGRVWLDTTAAAGGRLAHAGLPAGSYRAAGVIGFLQARLVLQVASDGGWTVAVDNHKNDHADFVVRAAVHEVRTLTAGR